MNAFFRAVALLLVLAVSGVACAGRSTSLPPTPRASTAANAGAKGAVRFTFTIPKKIASASNGRKPTYISANSSVLVVEWSASGTYSEGTYYTDSTFLTTACAALGTSFVCTVTEPVPLGTFFLRVTLKDASNHVLSIGTTANAVTVQPDTTTLLPPITLTGVPSTISLSVGNAVAKQTGLSEATINIPVTLTVRGADGATITGPGNYATPIQIGFLDAVSTRHVKLALNGNPIASASQTVTVTAPSDTISLVYDGTGVLTANLVAFVANASIPSVYASFAPQQIATLGVGNNFGSGANVIAGGFFDPPTAVTPNTDGAIYTVDRAGKTIYRASGISPFSPCSVPSSSPQDITPIANTVLVVFADRYAASTATTNVCGGLSGSAVNIPATETGYAAATNPVTRTAYVASFDGTSGLQRFIATSNGSTSTAEATVSLPVAQPIGTPAPITQMVVSPDGNTIYALQGSSTTANVFKLQSNFSSGPIASLPTVPTVTNAVALAAGRSYLSASGSLQSDPHVYALDGSGTVTLADTGAQLGTAPYANPANSNVPLGLTTGNNDHIYVLSTNAGGSITYVTDFDATIPLLSAPAATYTFPIANPIAIKGVPDGRVFISTATKMYAFPFGYCDGGSCF